MRINEIITETVNPDIFNMSYDEPFISKPVQMGDFVFDARNFLGSRSDFDAKGLQIRAYDPQKPQGQQLIGSADFILKTDNKGNAWLESDDTDVDEDYRSVGVASMMYAFAKMLGNDVRPSPFLSTMGANMWRKWNKQGDVHHLTGTKALRRSLRQPPRELN